MRSLIFLVLLIQAGCTTSRAWVVQRYDGGAVIGYERGNSQDADNQLDEALSYTRSTLCPSNRWAIINEQLKSATSLQSIVIPHTATSTTNSNATARVDTNSTYYNNMGSQLGTSQGQAYGTAQSTSTTTTNWNQTEYYTNTNYWKEARVKCLPTVAQERKQVADLCLSKNDEEVAVESCFEAGVSYWTEGNTTKAESLLDLSCKQGYKAGCASLLEFRGDYEGSKKLLQTLCDDEDAKACTNLAYLIQNKRPLKEVASSDLATMKVVLTRACGLGNKEACSKQSETESALNPSKLSH